MAEKKLESPKEILDRLESINIQRGYLMHEINEKRQQVHLMESKLQELEVEGSKIYSQIANAKEDKKKDVPV